MTRARRAPRRSALLAAAALVPALVPHPFVLTIATQAVIWALLAASWDLLERLHRPDLVRPRRLLRPRRLRGGGRHQARRPLAVARDSCWARPSRRAVGFATGFPALRLRGHYLALVTLGLAEIIRLVAQNWLAAHRAGRSASTTSARSPGCPRRRSPTARRSTSVVAIVGASVAGDAAHLRADAGGAGLPRHPRGRDPRGRRTGSTRPSTSSSPSR